MIKKILLFFIFSFSIQLIFSQCDANFNWNGKKCFNDTIQFNFIGTGTFLSWNFDDNSSGSQNFSNDSVVQHVFSDTGTFQVMLIVSDTGSCIDTLIQSIRIFEKPKVNFTIENQCLGYLSRMINNSLPSLGDSISNFLWKFGDGNSSNSKNPTHNYTSSGTKNIKLKATSINGCSDSFSKTINIYNNPNITFSDDSVCQTTSVLFDVSVGSDLVNQYSWQLGDATSQSTQSFSHIYNSPGKKKVSLTINYQNGGFCKIDSMNVYVFKQPNASFKIKTPKMQCFKSNQTCIEFNTDTTNIISRTVLWDDGSSQNVSSNLSTTCYQFNNPAGGSYRITQDVTDTNGCATRFTISDSIIILKDPRANFTINKSGGCFKSLVVVNNTSNMTPPTVEKFYWDWSDGFIDSSSWTGAHHTYTANGAFKIKLKIIDTFGCIDTFVSNENILNTSYVVDAVLDDVIDSCRRTNLFSFKQTPITGATIKWYFGDTDSSSNWSVNYRYNRGVVIIGQYLPYVKISKNGCDSIKKIDTATVYGPYAHSVLTNQYQCQIKDTVFFRNASLTFRNKKLAISWNARDPFANNCTIDTRNNIYPDSNCNFSVDSLYFKHFYTKGQENCYSSRITVSDSIIGCTDYEDVAIPLMPPDASTGIDFTYLGSLCLGPESIKRVRLDLRRTVPNCGREAWWVMWDSTCARQSNNFDSYWRFNQDAHNFNYVPCNPDGSVTIGIIIQNGTDTLNNICRDTFFYHKRLQFGVLDPRFTSTYNDSNQYCKGSQFNFHLRDSTMDSIVYVRWDFGDGTVLTTTDLSYKTHRYKNNGVYNVTVYMEHANGCVGIDSMRIRVGVNRNYTFSKTSVCVGDSVILYNNSSYYGGPNYWQNPLRSGVENTRWDIGDGNGFSYNSPIIKVAYPKIGNYFVKMEYIDSIGCVDTLNISTPIRYFDVFSKMNIPKKVYTCAQVVQFFSTASVFDSLNNFGHLDDRIVKFSWYFNNGTSNSLLKNPFKFFKAGTHDVKLVVQNTIGCTDSISDQFTVLGPTAVLKIISDSVGCQPLAITFKNESLNANSYTYRYRNPSNAITNTSSKANITFTYTNFGQFYPDLIARNTFNNNGVNVTCADTFPAPNTSGYRLMVDVKEKPRPNFSHSTNCANNTTTFNNATIFSSGAVSKFEWFFGDGDTSQRRSPVHQYPDTGAYRVVLKAYSAFGCIDSIVRVIYVSPFPSANFNFTEVCIGNPTVFTDQSNAFNDILNLWVWNFGNGLTSNARNPNLIYSKDSLYNVRLTVRNRAGCTHAITKQVNVWARPRPQFNVNNVCHKTAHQFTNNTTSKQNPYKIRWHFDNQGIDSSFNTQFKFNDSGNFNVKLIATSIKGCKDSITKKVRAFPNPKANFNISIVSNCLNENRFNFTNNSKVNSDSFVSFHWSSVDQIATNFKNFSFHFDSAKIYPIRLISTTNRNCKDTIIKNIQVFQSPFAKSIISTKNECINGDSVEFRDISTVDSLNVSRKWVYLNQTISLKKNFNYKFNSLNQHRIMLEVNNIYSCKDTIFDTLVIHPKPIAKIGKSIKEQCFLNHRIVLNDSSTVADFSSLSRKWQFGNGDSSIIKNQNYIYAQADTFRVRLISQSAWNCKDTTFSRVVIHPMPNADFVINNDSQCLRNNLFAFTNQSTIKHQTPLTHQWQFGNSNNSLLTNPTQNYVNNGNYTVRLISSSNFNCKDTVFKNAVVHPMPKADFKFKDSALCFLGHQIETHNQTTIPYTNFNFYWSSYQFQLQNQDTFKIQYPKDSVYFVKLKAVSEYNCMDSVSKKANIWPMPISAFKIDTANQCFRNNLFHFTNLSTAKDGALQFKWHFGDLDSSSNRNPQHQYNNEGNFNVQLISSSIHACRDTITQAINVFPMPNAVVWMNNPNQCLNTQNFEFRDTSNITNGTLKSQWIWYNHQLDTSKTIIRTFNLDSALTHQLVSISDKNCADSTWFTTTIHSVPVSNFTINDTDQCVNVQQYQMSNLSTIKKGSLSYVWSFGDSTQSTLIHPTHHYTKGGFYDIQLLAISEHLCKDSVQKTVRVYFKPDVSISTNSSQCLLGNHFILKGTSSIGEGQLINYYWYKDGNLYSRKKDTSIIYQTQGTYSLMYVLESNFACLDTLIQTLTVHPMPLASFTINDSVQCENKNLFEITSTSTIPYSSKTEKWQFSDGDTDTGIMIQRQYNYSDTIHVQLISESEFFCRDTAYNTIFNQPQPFVSFVINDTNQCQRFNSFLFENKSVIGHGSMDFVWDFGDGNDTNTIDAQHSYNQHREYLVQLSALSNYDCRDTQIIKVIVFPDPKADFSISNNSQCLRNNAFQFQNLSSIDSSNVSYWWTLGNGFNSSLKNLNYTYPADGQYTVNLYVNSAYNCKDSISKNTVVHPMPKAQYNVNDSNQCINEQFFVFSNQSTVKLGKIDSTQWWINDLFFNQTNTVNTRYSSSGLKNTFLRVVSDSNCTDTFYKTIRIYPKPSPDFLINDSVQCIENNAFTFSNNSSDSFGITTINWYIDRVLESQSDPLQKTFTVPKTYQITLNPISIFNCKDTIDKQIRVKPMPNARFNLLKPYYCNDEAPFNLIPNVAGGLFSGKNVQGNLLYPNQLWKDTVTYTITVDGCTSSSSQNTQIYPFPEIELGNDTLLCKHEAVLLKATNWNSEYYWHDGRTDAEYLAFKPGLYYVTAKNICGSTSDSIVLKFRAQNCRLYLPTAFTPGKNGINDFYKPVTFGVDEMEYEIFNRWGEKVYEGDINSAGWDGTYMGESVYEAYFLIKVNYSYHTGFKKVAEYEKEVFYLLR